MSLPTNYLIVVPMIIVCFGHFLVDIMIGIFPVYKTLAHIDLAVAGLIGGFSAFAGEGLQMVFGSLSDKGYRRAILLCGIIAATASSFLIYTSSYLSLFALYLITCIGSGAFHPSAASLVSDLSPKNKSLFISLFTSSGAFGMAFSQIIFRKTHLWFDGHLFLLAIPAVLLVLFALTSQFGKQAPAVNPNAHRFNLKLLAEFFKHPPLRNLYFTQVCNASMMWGMMFLLPDLLNSRGFDPWIAFGGGHMMFILGAALMMVPAGFLADRYSCRSVILASMGLGMTLFYLLLLSADISDLSLLAILFCLGATIGMVQPVAISLGTTLAPSHKGMISAFLMGMVWCISEGIGQIGGGFLATCFTDDAPAKALASLGVFFLIGAVFTSQLPQNEDEPLPIKNII
jgi:FSR family fosmidomycin resistance protein-like MFS transporter